MKVEKKEIVIGSTVGIIIGLILGVGAIVLMDMVKENNQRNEYFNELEFHEKVRMGTMNYRSSLDVESSDYLFEYKINGVNYLVWVKYNDVFDYFDYSYARLGR